MRTQRLDSIAAWDGRHTPAPAVRSSMAVSLQVSLTLLLVGGGFGPPLFGLIRGLAATRINAPPTWWRARLPDRAWRILSGLWPWLLAAALIAWLLVLPGSILLDAFKRRTAGSGDPRPRAGLTAEPIGKEQAMNTSRVEPLVTPRPRLANVQIEATDSTWKRLYIIAGAAALISAVCIPLQMLVFIVWPPPLAGTAGDWFTLFRTNQLIGLINLDLLLVVDNILLIPIWLALYVALRRSDESIMMIATALAMLGIVLFIVTNPAIVMLSLSERYTAAATDTERAIFLAAGQAALAGWQGTAFHVGYILSSVAGIAMPLVMLKGAVFSKATAYLGVGANLIGLGLYLPVVGLFLALFSVVFLEVWYILIARRLLQLGRRSWPVN